MTKKAVSVRVTKKPLKDLSLHGICEGCRFYKPEGWAVFAGKGGLIHEGPCRHYTFYNWEAAKRACGGRLREVATIGGLE